MKVLFLGDVVGRLGVDAIIARLPKLIRQYDLDFVIVNGENAAKGRGLFYKDYRDLVDAGVDCITLGNHYRSKQQIDDFIEDCDRLVRPANLRDYDLGEGALAFDCNGQELVVVNLLGKAFMTEEVNSGMVTMEEIIDSHPDAIFFVDYHGEATSEKGLFAHFFDGEVAAVIGTHTHVQTNDARVLPKGTAFMSDAGYCGLAESVLGFTPESAIQTMVYGNGHLKLDEEADARLCGAIIDIDEGSKLARGIETINLIVKKEEIHG